MEKFLIKNRRFFLILFRNLFFSCLFLILLEYITPLIITKIISLKYLISFSIIFSFTWLFFFILKDENKYKKILESCFKYVFLFCLILITLYSLDFQFIKDIITTNSIIGYIKDKNFYLALIIINLGFFNLFFNREEVKKTANNECANEASKEEKRCTKFTNKFSKINITPFFINIVKQIHKEGWWYNLGLISIISVAIAVRLYKIATLDYWIDEFYSMTYAQSILDGNFPYLPSGLRINGHYLYFFSLSFFIKLFGFNQFSGRIANIAISVLIILLLYITSKYFFKNKKIGLISGFLFSMSPLAINMAKEIRYYELTFFFSLIFFYVFYRITTLINKNGFNFKKYNNYKIILLLPILLLGLDTHILLSLLVIGYFIYFVFYFYKKKPRYLINILFLSPLILIFFTIVSYHSLNILEGLWWGLNKLVGTNRPVWATQIAPITYHIKNLFNNSGYPVFSFLSILALFLSHILNKKRTA